jgi:hypothetical protein
MAVSTNPSDKIACYPWALFWLSGRLGRQWAEPTKAMRPQLCWNALSSQSNKVEPEFPQVKPGVSLSPTVAALIQAPQERDTRLTLVGLRPPGSHDRAVFTDDAERTIRDHDLILELCHSTC